MTIVGVASIIYLIRRKSTIYDKGVVTLVLEISLIRNGVTESGEMGRFTGLRDEPLSEGGVGAIKRRRENNIYPKVSRVYTGPLRRCLETTSLIYGFPALVMEGLSAFDYGELTGKPYAEMVGDEQFEQWAGSEWLRPMANGTAPYVSRTKNLRNFRDIVEEMETYRITTAAVIAHRIGILLILNKYAIPSVWYADRDIKYGGGCTVLYDTSLSALKVKNTF